MKFLRLYNLLIIPALLNISFYMNPKKSITEKNSILEKKIDSLLAKMTIDEKIGQTAQRGTPGTYPGEISDTLKDAVRHGAVGSVINVINRDHLDELQRLAVEESPNSIPLISGRDVIHGFRTIFPIPLGLAATWNPDLVEKISAISAEEATTYGIRWTFAPMLDISRDPRWGRIAEGSGEDPYLASVMAAAYVKGFQGDNLSDRTSIAACAKHFAGYGAAEGGRDYNTAIIHEQLFRDVYLKPFKAACDAGAATFMTSFNEVNGIPSSGNKFLVKQILREEWGFDGFVVSDWESIKEMIVHGFCEDTMEAAFKAADAGLDMEMMSDAYEKNLKILIEEGKISEGQLDEFVRNILRIKFRLGLFENPYTDRSRDDIILSKSNLAAAKEAALQSLVLLKNDKELLPLSKDIGRVAIIGPLADAPYEQFGTWVFDGEEEDSQTPLPSLRRYIGEEKVVYSPGLTYSRERSKEGFAGALKSAEQSDVIIFFAGEESILSGESHSRADISLPGVQEELIHELRKMNKPLVLVIMAGRPITIGNIINDVDAILMAWHPGTMGGPAITDVLFGKAYPCGRLPVTWPKAVGQIPIYYNHNNTGRPGLEDKYVHVDDIPVGAWQHSLHNSSFYMELGIGPQFPFGYGLGYTEFKYDNIGLSKDTISLGETLEVSAEITNTGSKTGTEIVQLYVRDLTGSMVRPVKELKGFKRIKLNPGDTEKITFSLNTDELSFYNQNMELVTEPGRFKVWIGRNAEEGLEAEFNIK
jgi:beta-glucosidase